MACRTCPYQYIVKKKMYETIRMKRKEVDDVLGGDDAWENVDSTDSKAIVDPALPPLTFQYNVPKRAATAIVHFSTKCRSEAPMSL